jgi:2,6-dihydroxypseudooxynicotine hydrolase
MPEPRLAIARLSRFTVNGVAASDFEDVLNSLESWDDWCRAWSQRASIHESKGREALAKGRNTKAVV